MKHDSDILKRIKSYFMRRKSSQEAHAFERKAEGDAFLYEAMEGFEGMLTSDIQQAMDELDDRLDEKSKKIVLPINWRAAASIAAVISIGTLLYFTVFNGKSADPKVASESNEENKYSPRDDQADFDSMGEIAMDTDTAMKVDSVDVMPIAADAVYAVQEMPAPPPPLTSTLPAEEEVAVLSRFADDDNEVVETVSEMDDISSESMDSEGITEEFEMAAAEPKSRMRSAALSEESFDKPAAKKEDAKAVQPANGWAGYNGYLKSNLKTSENMPSGSVTLSFELDRNGKPKKIAVVKSLCTACDAEAIRLVANGPAWKSEDKKAKGSVSVSFP